jgi:hypothetical protein
MRVLSATACTGRSFDEFLDIYNTLKEPLQLSAVSLAVGINFTTDDIPKIKQAGIDTVLWHDAFWFVDGRKQETYPSVAHEYFALHKLFCAADIDVPLWSIHPYKSHRPKDMWTDEIYANYGMQWWDDLDYVLPRDDNPESDYHYNVRSFNIVLENMLPNAPCYNNLDSVLQSDFYHKGFCIDYSHINIWTKNNNEQTIAQCLLATTRAREIHLSSNKGHRDSHDYIEENEWFMPYLDSIEQAHPHLYITYESLPVQYKQYGRLDKR